MTQKFINFYENLAEAHLRLRSTYVVYDKEPYYVVAITNHKDDGVFRIYLCPLSVKPDGTPEKRPSIDQYDSTNPALGEYLDKWLTENPSTRIIRKKMDSPKFNKFRPFRLGMCNYGTTTFYLERQPRRQTHQGLVRGMVGETLLSASPAASYGGRIEFFSQDFHDCIVGDYPTADECLKALTHPDIENDAAAFHREFALVRGPIDMMFLAYKTDVVGVLPRGDFGIVKLGRDWSHVREAVEELNLFSTVISANN